MITTQITGTPGRLRLLMPFDPKQVGRRIARARKRKGWSQVAFASELHVSPSSVSRWERGKLPPVRELLRIGDMLGIDMGEFLDEPVDATTWQLSVDARLNRIEALQRDMLEELRRSRGDDPPLSRAASA